MAEEKTVTFTIKGPDGKPMGEQTVNENFAPLLLIGQTAVLKDEPTAPAAAPASKKAAEPAT